MNHRLRRRHRYLIAVVAAAVLLGTLLAARRPIPDARMDRLPQALDAPASPAPGRQASQAQPERRPEGRE